MGEVNGAGRSYGNGDAGATGARLVARCPLSAAFLPGGPLPLLLVLAACVLAFGGCGGGKESKGPTATSTPLAQDVLRASADRLASVKSFHFVFDHENGGLAIVLDLSMRKAEGDMLTPNRIRADVTAIATKLGNIRVETQFIAVDDAAKIRNPFDRTQWVSLPGSTPLAKIFDPAAGAVALLRSVQNPAIAAGESIGGVPTWRVEGMLNATDMSRLISTAEAGYQVKGIVWIGQDDNLLYRVRLEGPAGPDEPANLIRKLEFSRYDQPVSIDLP